MCTAADQAHARDPYPLEATAFDDTDLALMAGEPPSPPARALPPDAVKARMGSLVRQYVAHRSAQLARAIARDSESLALHPALRDAPEDCTAFCRLNRHWRVLAAECPAVRAS